MVRGDDGARAEGQALGDGAARRARVGKVVQPEVGGWLERQRSQTTVVEKSVRLLTIGGNFSPSHRGTRRRKSQNSDAAGLVTPPLHAASVPAAAARRDAAIRRSQGVSRGRAGAKSKILVGPQ